MNICPTNATKSTIDSVKSLSREEERRGTANLQNSKKITKPLPKSNLSEEIDHLCNTQELGDSSEKKQATSQNLQDPGKDHRTPAR